MAKSSQVHLSHLVELQCLQDLEDLPGDVNETGLCSSRVHAIKYLSVRREGGISSKGSSTAWSKLIERELRFPPALDVPGEELMKMPTVTLGTLRRKWWSSGGPPWKSDFINVKKNRISIFSPLVIISPSLGQAPPEATSLTWLNDWCGTATASSALLSANERWILEHKDRSEVWKSRNY